MHILGTVKFLFYVQYLCTTDEYMYNRMSIDRFSLHRAQIIYNTHIYA